MHIDRNGHRRAGACYQRQVPKRMGHDMFYLHHRGAWCGGVGRADDAGVSWDSVRGALGRVRIRKDRVGQD
jgi:hypothetical protein